MDWLHALVRWIHVVAGVLWIGHLYFFNFVNGPLAKTYDADSKRKVVPELMPRALYFFRWGAAYTWVTGILLLGIVYYNVENLGSGGAMIAAIGLGTVLVGAAIYDVLWSSPLAKNATAALAVSVVLLVALVAGLTRAARDILGPPVSDLFLYIHVGAMFGTIMAMNVWMRIWPAQRKIIAAIRDGAAPDPALVARAGLRSRHNTFLSVPLIFTMVSNHFPAVYSLQAGGMDVGWIVLLALVAVGWGSVHFLYQKAGSADTAKF